MRHTSIKILASVSLLALMSACAQAPAQVVMKGHESYAQRDAFMRVASTRSTSAPEMTLEDVNVANAEVPTSYATTTVQTASLDNIAIKELEPVTAVNSAPVQQAAILPEPQAREVASTAPAMASSSHGYIWPVKGKVISKFGPIPGGAYNDGINIAAREGEPIVAAADGEVVYSGNELRDYGNMVIVRHEGGIMTAYAHAGRVMVSKGDNVKQGATIATVGKTGSVDQAQVHFGIRKNKEPVDPMGYLSSNNFASAN